MICIACRVAMRSRALPLRSVAQTSATLLRSTKPRASFPTPTTRAFSTSLVFRNSAVEDLDLPSMTPAESAIADILSEKLSPTELLVQDVSGGCGSMYAIDITSAAFKGQTILKQQRMVNAALGDLVKAWHGVQIRTKVPPQDA